MATERQHAAAVVAAVNAALANRTAYEPDEVPATRPTEYVEVTVTRRFGGESRLPGRKGTTGWRITTRPVSQSSLTDCQVMAEGVRTGLEDVFLSVAGETTSPVQFESAEPIGPDDGWFSGLSTWTYIH